MNSLPGNHFEQRSVRVNAWPAEPVAHRGLGVLHHPGDRLGNVLDIGGFQLRLTASEKREDGRRRNILAIGIRKASPRPNITEGRMSVVAEKASRTAFSPFPRLRIYGEAESGIGANAGNVDEPPDARFSRKPGDPCCGFDVNGMEGLWPALRVEAHDIHDALGTRDGSGNGAIVIDVG